MIGLGKRRPVLLLLLAGALLLAAATWIFYVISNAIPPRRVVMTTGPEGGSYRELGERYKSFLARYRVRLELRSSLGNVENLQRLKDRKSGVSVGFVSGGLTTEDDSPGIVSLGTIAYYPLWIFCRGTEAPKRLLDLKGKRISVGPEGGGTRPLALELFRENQMEDAIKTVALSPGPSGDALLAGEIDCACMLTTADAPVVKKLLADPNVSLVSYARADAYVALHPYLRKVVIPEGVGNMPANLPPHDVTLIASTANILIREELHPAIQFLLLQAADELHSPGGVLRQHGQFPAPESVDVPLSAEARPFYKSGGSYLQRHLPFWLWVFTSRLLLLLVPIVGIAYPVSQIIPAIWDMVVNFRLNRLYAELRSIEARMDENDPREELAHDFEGLRARILHVRVPGRNARTLYTLRHHMSLVSDRLEKHGIPLEEGL